MKRLFWVLALFVISVSSVLAQLTTSALVGTVEGPDGLIPGANVVVRDSKTGKEVTTVTNEEGSYRVPNLEVGAYTVTITAQGFKTFTVEEVKIDVSKDYSLATRLEVGGPQETVTVTAGAEIINSVDAEINSTVSRKQLDDLPSLGRNPLNFVTLQPGVANNPNQQPVINGIRTSATNITIDGINVQDNYIRSNATAFSPARPTVDEVEEFAVSTQSNADDGFGGAQIQFSTRRGGNDYHFRLFEFNRNSEFAANNFFNNANRVKRPFRNRNQFGGNVSGPLPFFNFGDGGGPLFISGRDKLFFFFAYEKLIDIQPADPQFSTVLTGSARQGIFTYTDNSGQIRQVNILNPAFNTGITAINPIIANRFLANIPQGNSTQVGDQLNTTGFQVTQNNNQEQTNYTTRIDYQVNPLNTLTGTYRYVKQDVNRADIDNSFNTDPRVTQPSANPFLSIGLISAISSNFTNEVRAGFFSSDPTFLRKDPLPATFFTLPLALTNPEVTFENQGRKVKTYNVQDNANYTLGDHRIRFGGQYQKVDINSFAGFSTVPTYTIGTGTATPSITTAQFTNTTLFPGGVPVAQRGGANSLLALLGGIVSAGSQTLNVTSRDSGFVPGATERRLYSYNILGFHLSDQWRVTPDLTLNIGFRYDRYSPLKSLDGIFLEPAIPNSGDPVSAILDPNGRYQFVGGNAGKEGLFYKADNNNIAPVLSFAYAPKFEKGIGAFLFGASTVIRGGYRISYINDELVRAPDNALGGNQGLSLTARAFNGTSTALNARIDNPPVIPIPPFTGDNRTFAQNNASAGNFGTVFAIDPNIATPFVHEYSFGIQREIGFDTAIEIRYVGTRSNNLLRGTDYNQVIINENGFLTDFNRARGNLLGCQAFFAALNQPCPTGAGFNSSVPGSQQLTVFPNLASGGLLTNGTITGLIQSGQVAQLAFTYLANNLQGSVGFVPNRNAGVADLLTNGGAFHYNALQVDLRRRFTNGFALNANYTFSKNLTNSVGTGQTRFEPFLDINQPELERSRADFDQTHKFNLLANYELPFGKGKPFVNKGLLATLLGNFQIGAIVQIGSGAPITVTDPIGTLNRSGRSGRQTAVTALTAAELRNLAGIYRTPNGIFFLPPEVLGRNPDGTINSSIGGTGRGSNGLGTNFRGQVFFNNTPGTTSSLGRAVFSGPTSYNLDLALIKRFVIGEKLTLQLQADLFNALNNVNFIPGQFLDINSTTFGRISSVSDPRVVQLAFRVNF